MKKLLLIGLIMLSLAFAVWLVPYFLPPEVVSSRSACITNLEYLERLKGEWVGKNPKMADGKITEEDLFGEMWTQRIPKCPSGGDYHLGSVKENATCSVGGPAHSLQAARGKSSR